MANKVGRRERKINLGGLLSGIAFYMLCLGSLGYLKGDESITLKINMALIIFLILINAWTLFQVALYKETGYVRYKKGFIAKNIAAVNGALNSLIMFLVIGQMTLVLMPDLLKVMSPPVISAETIRPFVGVLIGAIGAFIALKQMERGDGKKGG